jgi:TatD DNase family protein
MEIIDSHTHLNMDEYNDDIDEVINRAIKKDVKTIIDVGFNQKSIKKSLLLSEKYKNIYSVIGIHPHDAKDVEENYFETLEEFLKYKKVLAIGEIGLDYYRNYSPKEVQKKIFLKQIEISLKLDIPIVIHCRNAYNDMIEILKEKKMENRKILFHCFSGDENIAKELLNMGFYFSFAGYITYPNIKKPYNVIKMLPIEKIIIETDSPFLSPQNKRRERNEPSYIIYTLEKIAEIKNLPLEETAEKIFKNTINFFNL